MTKFKIILSALAISMGLAAGVQAGDMTAHKGQSIDLGTVSGFAYYTVEEDGYRVVATLADPDSKALRFEAVLTPGQTVVLSSPASIAQAPARIQISRVNDRISVQNLPVTN